MAISLHTAGSWVAATATTQTVTLPTHSTGDMLIVRVGFKHATMPTTVTCGTAGWAKVATEVNGTGGASTNGGGGVEVCAFWKVATSAAETNPVITFNGGVTAATPSAATGRSYSKGELETWVTPVGNGAAVAAATSISATIASHISATSGDLIDEFHVTNDNTTLTVPTFTQTGLTLAAVVESPAAALSSGTSNDISADGCYRIATAGTSSAAAVITGTNSVADLGAAWTTRLRVTPGRVGQATALVSGAAGTATTASFTPTGQMLVATVCTDGATDATIVVSDSLGGAWTMRKERLAAEDAGNVKGNVAIWTSTAVSGGARTVSADDGPINASVSLQVWEVFDSVGTPTTGATGSGGTAATDTINPTAYTSTADDSWGFCVDVDFADRGAGSSTDVEFAFNITGISGQHVTKAAATATSGTGVVFNLNGADGFTEHKWCALEIKAGTGGDALTASADDTLAISDAVTLIVQMGVPDTLAISDAQALEVQKVIADSAAISDAQTLLSQLTVADALAISDAAPTIETGKATAVDDTLAISDANVLEVQMVVPDTLAITDARVLEVQAILADTLGLSDAQAILFEKVIADALAIADAQPTAETGVEALIDDTLGIADATSLEQGKGVADTVAIVDNVVLEFAALVIDSVGIADLIAFVVEHFVWVDDALSISDAAPTTEMGRGVSIDDVLAIADEILTGAGGSTFEVFINDTLGGGGAVSPQTIFLLPDGRLAKRVTSKIYQILN